MKIYFEVLIFSKYSWILNNKAWIPNHNPHIVSQGSSHSHIDQVKQEKVFRNTLSPHLTLSIGYLTISKITYNKNNFTIGNVYKQELRFLRITTLWQNNVKQKDIILEAAII